MNKYYRLYEHQAQYYETDQMGIIHHSNYIRWFEESRTDLLEQIGFGYDQMEKQGISIPVLGITCDYKSMVRYPEGVYVIPKVISFNGIRLTLSYHIIDKETKELKAEGESRHCFLNHSNRPVSLKKTNPQLYTLFLSLLHKDLENSELEKQPIHY